MIKLLLESHSDSPIVKQYLEQWKSGSEKELIKFREEKEAEKQAKLAKIEEERIKRENDLKEREGKMLDWEDRMAAEEAKHMSAFEKQKQAIMAKKRAEQKDELMMEMSKDDLERIRKEHQIALDRLETEL